jgi:4-hydroxybenzoate polyprenyltransferase
MLKRIQIYLAEMFPPTHLIPALLLPVSFLFALAVLDRFELRFSLLPFLGSISIVLFILILRVMDEIKDYADDLVNYPDRPLPSGRVLHSDLRVLLGILTGLVFLANIFNQVVGLAALCVFAYSLLMFKWFFIEIRMRNSLPLALISHNPIIYIYLVYIFVVYSQLNPNYQLINLAFALPLGASITQWEIARKIRLPQNESSYTTYSKIWGFKRAIALCLAIQIFSLASLGWFLCLAQAPWWLIGGFLVSYGLVSIRFIQFMNIKADPQGLWDKVIPLRRYAEWQGLILQITAVLAYFVR